MPGGGWSERSHGQWKTADGKLVLGVLWLPGPLLREDSAWSRLASSVQSDGLPGEASAVRSQNVSIIHYIPGHPSTSVDSASSFLR